MAVNKAPGDTCYVTVGSIDYMGPPVTMWLNAMIVQGEPGQLSYYKYISPGYQVNFPGAMDWTTVSIGLTLVMNPRGGYVVNPGLADCIIAIYNSASLVDNIYTQVYPGAFNFAADYPASAWRGASGTFAAQVSGMEAQFGVIR